MPDAAAAPARGGAGAGRSAGVLGVGLLLLVAAAGLLAPLIAPSSPFALDGAALQPPSASHPMGTDDLGRDVYSAVVHGARASTVIAVATGAVIGVVGIGVGALSGYRGGWVDDGLMRGTELVQVLPRFFLAIVVVALFGPGIDRLVLVLGLTSWPTLARIVRAEVLTLRELDFIEAARALGAGHVRILRCHLLPGVLPIATAYMALAIAQVLLVEASLGFIGLSDPSVMTWGLLAGNARQFVRSAWWLALFPGLAIAVAVLGLNLAGDALAARLSRRGDAVAEGWVARRRRATARGARHSSRVGTTEGVQPSRGSAT